MPKKGIDGENTAAAFLEEKGMRILERNFRHARGEVDIIAMDDQTLVFAEVKTWSVYGIEALEYAIDKKKQQKIIETAKYFLSTNRKYKYMAIRFDVLFISLGVTQGVTQGITHLASAFTEGV